MKQFLIFLVAAFVMSTYSMQGKAQANFEPGQLGITAGASYGLDMEEPGLRAGLTYFITENLRVGVDATYWLREDELRELEGQNGQIEEISITGYEINGNLHFLFLASRNLVIYGAGSAGLHFEGASSSSDIPEPDTSGSEFAVGAGLGAELNFGLLSFFAEPKIFFNGLFDQVKINGGIRLYL